MYLGSENGKKESTSKPKKTKRDG